MKTHVSSPVRNTRRGLTLPPSPTSWWFDAAEELYDLLSGPLVDSPGLRAVHDTFNAWERDAWDSRDSWTSGRESGAEEART